MQRCDLLFSFCSTVQPKVIIAKIIKAKNVYVYGFPTVKKLMRRPSMRIQITTTILFGMAG